MAKTVPLIDTSIFIEALRGNNFNDYFYSVVTRKELFKKRGLSKSEELEIEKYLARGRIFFIDTSILEGVRIIAPLFHKKQINDHNDMVIAATALVKHLPLLTLNRKHFSFIKGLKLIIPS